MGASMILVAATQIHVHIFRKTDFLLIHFQLPSSKLKLTHTHISLKKSTDFLFTFFNRFFFFDSCQYCIGSMCRFHENVSAHRMFVRYSCLHFLARLSVKCQKIFQFCMKIQQCGQNVSLFNRCDCSLVLKAEDSIEQQTKYCWQCTK